MAGKPEMHCVLREVYHNLSHPSTPQDSAAAFGSATSEQPDDSQQSHAASADAPYQTESGDASVLSDGAPAAKRWKQQHPPAGEKRSSGADVVFPEEFEKNFASAVFEIGLRQSSPKVLMGLMPQNDSLALTTEHIKSHLQKYRLHYERSKEEFLEHFQEHLRLPSSESQHAQGAESQADVAQTAQPADSSESFCVFCKQRDANVNGELLPRAHRFARSLWR
jgi:SHAQKYF class myb-like DNA-binding protein